MNNTRIDAENGSLVVQTVNNDNDWDGAGGTGALNAISGDLEIHDNESFPFTGTVTASAGRSVFARGFELEFQPGSTSAWPMVPAIGRPTAPTWEAQ